MVQITCINKDGGNHYNPHESIEYLGWIEGGTTKRTTLAGMVAWLEKGNQAYTEDRYGNKAWLSVRTSANGNKYVQTHADGKWNNNLLALNECRI